MIKIDVSEDARAAGRLSGEELRAAVDALRTDGFVVLNDVVETNRSTTLPLRKASSTNPNFA